MWLPFVISGFAGYALGSLFGGVVLLIAFDVILAGMGVSPSAAVYCLIALLLLLLPGAAALAGTFFDQTCLPGRSMLLVKVGGLVGFFILLNIPSAFDRVLRIVEAVIVGYTTRAQTSHIRRSQCTGSGTPRMG
jgi:hypothetical protein